MLIRCVKSGVIATGFVALILFAFTPCISPAQDNPGIRIIGLSGFDPTIGKRTPTLEFTWPVNRQVAALVRYETSGYDKRKSVEIFWEISNREGRQISKYSETCQVHAGSHEAALPVTFNLNEMFGSSQLTYKVEVKLVGGERLIKHQQFLLLGPVMPEINFTDLAISPAEGSDSSLGPGSNFSFSGIVSVRENTTGKPPSLVVWSLLSDDSLADDPWDDNPFSDLYWDWTQLEAPNGSWRFEISGRLPLKFAPGGSDQRPFEVFAVISFGDNPVSRSSISGVISGVDSELMISTNLDERLIVIERNWDWGFTDQEQSKETPAWPGQK